MERELKIGVPDEVRQNFCSARRIVIKIGTRVLLDEEGKVQVSKLREIAKSVAALRRDKREVIVVTSGAISAGMEELSLKERPKYLSELQMCAAVGQLRLMSLYEQCFNKYSIKIGQLLLTYDDLRHRHRHLNARNTFLTLLRNDVLPVVNENDVVSVDEIKFGDNDVLASLVVSLVRADALLILSTTDGLHGESGSRKSVRVPYLPKVTKEELSLVFKEVNRFSSGGMKSKLISAQRACDAGAVVLVANGKLPGIIERCFNGEDLGTMIGARSDTHHASSKKHWLRFFQREKGSLSVDSGASRALLERGGSLLPVGIREVAGKFGAGDPVDIVTAEGTVIARGLVEFSSDELQQITGRRSAEVRKILGWNFPEEAVHRDNLVLVAELSEEGASK